MMQIDEICKSIQQSNSPFMENKKKLTTASGRPYAENENTMTVGPRGPILLQDYILHERLNKIFFIKIYQNLLVHDEQILLLKIKY